MGKEKKELKRFESVAFIMLEVLDKAIKLKSLQLDEFKMKQNHEKEMIMFQPRISVNEKPLNVGEKYPSGGFIGSRDNGGEFVVNKKDLSKYSKLVDAINSDDFQAIAVPDFVLKELFPEKFETEEEKKSREEWISRGEKMSQFIFADYGTQNCSCPVCVANAIKRAEGV